jgi:hypothetical protein
VSGGGVAVCVIAVLAPTLLPGTSKGIVYAVLCVPMMTLYPVLLSLGLKPKFTRVNLYVDQKGVWADDAPLVARRDIGQAYIRPAVAAEEQRINDAGQIFYVTSPAYPMTVELITARGRVNIDPGGDQAAAAILTALGFPSCTARPTTGAARSFSGDRSSSRGASSDIVRFLV